MNHDAPCIPSVWALPPPPKRAYAEIVEALLTGYIEHGPDWCMDTVLNPTIDVKCSGIRKELIEKTIMRNDLPLLTLSRIWATPCQHRNKTDMYEWKRRKQGVKLRLVERVDDARTRNLLDWHLKQEDEQIKKRKYDAWQRRTRRGSIMSVAEPIPPIPALAKLYSDFRFEDGEPIDHFKIKYGISDSMTLEEWARITEYPLGPDVTAEQHAAWIAEWFGPEGLPEPERPETLQEQQMRWKRQGGRSPDEQFAWERGLPMPVTLVYPGRPVVKGDKKCPTK